MAKNKIEINRAPVLTLWATVVAERMGYKHEEALTLGKGVAGLNAQSKGRRLGIYEEKEEDAKTKEKKKKTEDKLEFVELMGRGIPAVRTPDGLRASINGETIRSETVQRYLEQKFGDDLDEARKAMEKLAKSISPKELEAKAFAFYEKFRPEIPEGKRAWGAKGELDIDYIESLAEE
jgi:hypothetical protein